MKSGPRNNLYMGLIDKLDGKEPVPGERWKNLSKRQQSRLHDLRALHRRRTQTGKFKKIAAWVKRIRKKLGVSQPKLADLLGVSLITVKRWEFGSGHVPNKISMDALRGLEKKDRRELEMIP